MRAERYDVLILGGGNAGMGVTVVTRAAGISVTMVEPGNWAGPVQTRAARPGLTEAKAKELGHKITVHSDDMADWLSTQTYAEPVAWAKVNLNGMSDRILAAHIIGPAGEELIHVFALAMRFGITAGQMRDTVYAFPTISADVKHLI